MSLEYPIRDADESYRSLEMPIREETRKEVSDETIYELISNHLQFLNKSLQATHRRVQESLSRMEALELTA